MAADDAVVGARGAAFAVEARAVELAGARSATLVAAVARVAAAVGAVALVVIAAVKGASDEREDGDETEERAGAHDSVVARAAGSGSTFALT